MLRLCPVPGEPHVDRITRQVCLIPGERIARNDDTSRRSSHVLIDALRQLVGSVDGDRASFDADVVSELVFDEEHGPFVLRYEYGRVVLQLRERLAWLLAERTQVVGQQVQAFRARLNARVDLPVERVLERA